jgi:hypothetical protein
VDTTREHGGASGGREGPRGRQAGAALWSRRGTRPAVGRGERGAAVVVCVVAPTRQADGSSAKRPADQRVHARVWRKKLINCGTVQETDGFFPVLISSFPCAFGRVKRSILLFSLSFLIYSSFINCHVSKFAYVASHLLGIETM